MDNRQISGITFTSHYFDPTLNYVVEENPSILDFYIWFQQQIDRSHLVAFHVPHTYIKSYIDTCNHSPIEEALQEVFLHQKVVELLSTDDYQIEDLYLVLLHYYCFTLKDDLKNFKLENIGISVEFDADYSEIEHAHIIDSETNIKEHHVYPCSKYVSKYTEWVLNN